MASKLEVKGLYKIFGPSPNKIIPLLREGQEKKGILKKTGNGVGVNNASFQVESGNLRCNGLVRQRKVHLDSLFKFTDHTNGRAGAD